MYDKLLALISPPAGYEEIIVKGCVLICVLILLAIGWWINKVFLK